MRKSIWGVMAILLCALPMTTLASVSDDQVTSIKIREADGTTGQDTNTGSGVKSGHIQDQAVTTSKIANGAVTNDKISGPISASKIDLSGFQSKLSNVIIVAKSGGDFTSVRSAVNSITDSSESNPYVIKVMPGIYDETSGGSGGVLNAIQLKNYISIQGSGIDATKLIMHRSTNIEESPYGGLIVFDLRLLNNVALSDMTIEASIDSCIYDGYGAQMTPINIMYSNLISLNNLKLIAKGSETSIGLSVMRTPVTNIKNIEITADTSSCISFPSTYANGITAFQDGAIDPIVTIYNSKISATGGKSVNEGITVSNGQQILLYNTEVSGTSNAIGYFYNPSSPGKVISVGSKINGNLNVSTDSKFFNSFDANLNIINYP